ncbi:RND family efflux transporter MFP subunit [Vreelandella songnenensis]|uniref:RND family efflux transporter MFP subunit n=1 Tax=Vreelandella songnenensis TaxID=1176243 RepID=A0A2T0UNB5_9GAMM|nr:efflux RND transporter periplasmic adaptor subunit [Halomonas songnenensis]PRY59394.1 RND family efflux transporter MFP subunit [Halomonas songnenensis]
MKPVFLGILLLIAPLILTGCGDDEEQQERPAQVVKLVEASQQEVYPGRRFVGRVGARSTVNYAFQVGGRITEFPAVQGAVIPQGELIAQLDQTDYLLQVRASEAEYEQARRNLNRQRTLRSQGAASQAALDAAIAEAERAETQLDSARQELEYTTLNAPFDALIARRLVENYTTVPPNTEIVRIQDISELRIRFNIPQAMMQHLENGRQFKAEAEIATLPGQRIPLEYREHVTEPDEVAQTFEVEFAPANEGIIALPGTTATVYIEPEAQIESPLISLPSSALDSDEAGEFRVWVFDAEEGVVNPQRVSVGEMVDDRVMITAGLEAGSRVVATGAHLLRDGMRVKPLDAAL